MSQPATEEDSPWARVAVGTAFAVGAPWLASKNTRLWESGQEWKGLGLLAVGLIAFFIVIYALFELWHRRTVDAKEAQEKAASSCMTFVFWSVGLTFAIYVFLTADWAAIKAWDIRPLDWIFITLNATLLTGVISLERQVRELKERRRD